MRKLLIFLFIATTLLSCRTEEQNKSTNKPLIKLGAIIPISGPAANLGTVFEKGLRLGMQEIDPNSKFRYNLVVEDDQLSPSKAATAAQKLLYQDKVNAIISTWSYGGNIVGPMLKKDGIPHIAVAWDPKILTYGTNNFLHLLSPKKFLPDFFKIFKAKNYKQLGLIYFTESGSEYCATQFKELARENGMDIVVEEQLLPDSADLSTVALKIKNAQPEIVFTNLVGFQTDALIRKLRTLRYPGEVTSMTGFDQMADIGIANGFWYISDSSPIAIPHLEGETYGLGNFYDYVKIIVSAYETWDGEGTPSPEWITNYINNIQEFKSAFGTLKFEDRTAVYPPRYYKIVEGKKIETTLQELMN